MARQTSRGGAFMFGTVIGIPAFIAVAKAFVVVVPAITAGLDRLL